MQTTQVTDGEEAFVDMEKLERIDLQEGGERDGQDLVINRRNGGENQSSPT